VTRLALVLCALVLASCGAAATPATQASPSATPTPAVKATLTVTPGSAPVGATVTLDGTGCQNPGQPTYLVFEGEGGLETGTVGAVDIPNIPTDATGHFHISFTIPAQLHTLQGRGGGPVRPGTYDFVSKPAVCLIQFTVTAS
jgi:hypothetical protein